MASTRNFIKISNKYDRVILLVDMDCFYCQVEEKLDQTLAGKPIAVVQYNAWRGGGIIAVNYAARAKGVTRHMRGDEAKEQCPEIELVKVPNVREKADLSKYRDAGKDVANVLQKFTNLLERASVDEAYLDITTEVNKRMENMNAGTFFLQPEIFINTYAVGYESIGQYINEITTRISHPCDDEEYSLTYDADDTPAVRKSDLRLLLGAGIASEIRAAVKKDTGYECSAGIAHNKILAKLACGMNKPNKQTILPLSQLNTLFQTLPVNKIKGLGGKFGFELCERLKVKFLGDLLNFSESDLQKKLDEKNGSWIYLMCRGIDLEAVTPRFYSKSIGCCKKFPGRNCITGIKTLEHWLKELGNEIAERLEKDFEENNRRAKQMVVSYIQELNGEDVSSSRSSSLLAYDAESIQKAALDVIKRNTDQFFKSGSDLTLNNAIKFLSISVGKFESNNDSAEKNTLQQMFANQKKKDPIASNKVEDQKETVNEVPTKTGALEKMFANQKVKEPKIVEDKKEEVEEPKKPGKLEKMFANQKNKTISIDVTEPDSSCLVENAKPTTRSFFAAHLNKIKQQQAVESIKSVQEENLYCDEAVPTSEENSRSDPSDNSPVRIESSSTSFFARTLQSMPPTAHQVNSPPKSLKRKSDSPEPSSSFVNNSYHSAYVELATPELREEFFTKCETCGQKILSDEATIQSHQDRHMAEELSRQQREEYRKDVQAKISQSTNQKKPVKSPITSANVNKKVKPNSPKVEANILKFMQPLSQPDGPSTSAHITCDKCGRAMHRDLMAEHLDYHYAKDLQVSLNKADMIKTIGGSSLNKSVNKSSPSTVKKSSSSVVSASKSKPITQFFSQR